MESRKHIFGLKRRCSVVDTLAKFLAEHSLEESREDEKCGELEVRSQLLVLTDHLERHRSYLEAFVSGPNDEPYLGVPDEEIEILTLASYKHETAYLLCGLHEWLMRLLEKHLEGEILTVLDRDDSPKAKYAELFVHGGIEAIRDSILPDIFTERYNKMERHIYRTCSVSRVNNLAYVRLPKLPARTIVPALTRLHDVTRRNSGEMIGPSAYGALYALASRYA